MTTLAFDNHASSTPIDAVRNIFNCLLSERDTQLPLSNSSSNRSRGSRLENKVGLNITDDEYVLLKLKEKEQKKTRSRKPRLSKDKTLGNKCRKTTAKSKKANKENKTFNDPEIAAAIHNLQTAVDITETTLDSDMPNDDFDFVL